MLNTSGLFKRLVRHQAVASLMLGMAVGALTNSAVAQNYPARPVRVIVPYGPGTAPDTIARFVSDAMQRRLGQPFIIENRTGAGGKIGTEAAASSPPDGYTLLLGTKDTQSIMAHLYPTWKIKPDKSLTPISGLARIENVLVTRDSFPASTLPEALTMAKSKELSYGSPGIGTNLHLMGELIKSRKNVKLLHIPYSRSFAEAFPAVMRGDVDLLIAGLPPMRPFLKDGRIKGLAITGTTRSKYMPNIPTFSEAGIQDLDTGGWFAFFAPTGTPATILELLEKEVNEVMKNQELQTRLEGISAESWSATPSDISRMIDVESKRWGRLIKDSHINVN